jgi:nucleoside-diphosphate-sugar epimerase
MRRSGQPFPGTGESYTNLIHLDDIVAALNFALEHRLEGIYHLCNDFHVPRKTFYSTICREMNLPPIQWDPSRENRHSGNKRASNKKLKDEGFVFSHPTWTR